LLKTDIFEDISKDIRKGKTEESEVSLLCSQYHSFIMLIFQLPFSSVLSLCAKDFKENEFTLNRKRTELKLFFNFEWLCP